MKIVDKDRHNLSNAEVLDWINRSQERFTRQGRENRIPKNYERITQQIKDYFERKDGPLEHTDENIKSRHKPATLELARILKAEPYALLKGEILMILNHRPRNRDVLATLIEESDARFPEDGQMEEILKLVNDHLGPVEDPEEVQRLKEQIAQEKSKEMHKAQSQTKALLPSSGPKANDGESKTSKSQITAEAVTSPMEDDRIIDSENEEAELWALMEEEAKANMEGTKDVEDSPLTKYMRELKLRRSNGTAATVGKG